LSHCVCIGRPDAADSSDMTAPSRPAWQWRFALFTAIGALLFSYRYLDDLAHDIHRNPAVKLIEEFTGAYSVLLLFPLCAAVVRRLPWNARRWPVVVAVQFLAAIAFSIAHTTLMAVSRAIAFPLAHLGRYDYGNMLYRYPMEMSNDIIVYTIIVGFLYFSAQLSTSRDRELKASQLETQIANLRLENLRLQLQPHFLFNTLNAISGVMYEDARAADMMIVRLSDFLRMTLEASEQRQATLDEELRITAVYVDIMRARLENALRFTCRVDENLRDVMVPSMLLQPLVENAIRHGMAGERSELEIAIDVSRQGDNMLVHVRDDGVGLRLPALAKNGGRGLTNTKMLLAQLYGDAYDVRITDRPEGGAEVTILLPIRRA
jgi:two-component system, LytTR family, sensor kinase